MGVKRLKMHAGPGASCQRAHAAGHEPRPFVAHFNNSVRLRVATPKLETVVKNFQNITDPLFQDWDGLGKS